MAKRMTNKSILLTDRQLKFLDRYGQQFSTQLREDLDTLKTLLRRGQKEISGKFTIQEVAIVNNMFREVSFYQPPASRRVLRVVMDDIVCGVSDEVLAKKLDELSDLGALAVIESVRRFWLKRNSKKNADTDELIKKTWPGM